MKIDSISDQDYFLLNNGAIVAAHGWIHPPEHVVGEILFVPDREGSRRFLGERYRKAFVKNWRAQPETEREQVRSDTGTFFDYAHLFSCKSIVPFDQISAHFRPVSLHADLAGDVVEYIEENLAEAKLLLGTDLDEVHLSLIGTLRLSLEGKSQNPIHDLDLVFTADVTRNLQIVRRLQTVAREQPARRMFENGKGWQIRSKTKRGILCGFFRYQHPSRAALAGLSDVRTLASEVGVTGHVVDDVHGGYLPTVITIEPVKDSLKDALGNSRLLVILNHFRARGDFTLGSIGYFRGALVQIETTGGSMTALSVVDADNCRLLTPPWEPYYRSR